MAQLRRWLSGALSSQQNDGARDYHAIPTAENEEIPPGRKRESKLPSFEYVVFLVLGCAMLWSWNMFMASATYFQGRFKENEYILSHFQALILVVTTLTNLGYLLYLQYQQSSANYPKRIAVSLVLNCFIFTLLAASTVTLRVGAKPYLAFTLTCVFATALATSLNQNGVFSFVNKFGGQCVHALMTGQAIAGVLPAVAQICIVLAVDNKTEGSEKSSALSACIYFTTATFVSGGCLALFSILLARHQVALTGPYLESTESTKDTVPISSLFRKLKSFSVAIWVTFAVTMVFPVFTQATPSLQPAGTGRFYDADVFIPLGFLIWNVGDLVGRAVCSWSALQCKNGMLLAVLAFARVGFIPLYYMCNVRGEGAVIQSDVFLWLVQLTFGLSNGWIASNCMMAAPEFVEEEEKEACGGYMGLCLVTGLAAGSCLSFLFFSM